MPLYMIEDNRDVVITQITGNDRIRNRLKDMGFVVGATVRIINRVDENVIVKVKGVSIALSHELARRIYA